MSSRNPSNTALHNFFSKEYYKTTYTKAKNVITYFFTNSTPTSAFEKNFEAITEYIVDSTVKLVRLSAKLFAIILSFFILEHFVPEIRENFPAFYKCLDLIAYGYDWLFNWILELFK